MFSTLPQADSARNPIGTLVYMTILERALRVGESKKFREFEKKVSRIADFEPELELESDEELRERYAALRERYRNGEAPAAPPPAWFGPPPPAATAPPRPP